MPGTRCPVPVPGVRARYRVSLPGAGTRRPCALSGAGTWCPCSVPVPRPQCPVPVPGVRARYWYPVSLPGAGSRYPEPVPAAAPGGTRRSGPVRGADRRAGQRSPAAPAPFPSAPAAPRARAAGGRTLPLSMPRTPQPPRTLAGVPLPNPPLQELSGAPAGVGPAPPVGRVPRAAPPAQHSPLRPRPSLSPHPGRSSPVPGSPLRAEGLGKLPCLCLGAFMSHRGGGGRSTQAGTRGFGQRAAASPCECRDCTDYIMESCLRFSVKVSSSRKGGSGSDGREQQVCPWG